MLSVERAGGKVPLHVLAWKCTLNVKPAAVITLCMFITFKQHSDTIHMDIVLTLLFQFHLLIIW